MIFISGKPKLLKGKARIFYRDETGSKFIEVPYEHLFCSRALGEQEALLLKKEVETNPSLAEYDIRIEIKPYGKTQNKVVQVFGPRKITKFLPKNFRTISAIDYLSWQFPVFAEFNPETLEVGALVDLETILQQEVLAADTEAYGREQGWPELTAYSRVWRKGKSINSIIRDDVIDSADLLKNESGKIRIIDPLTITAHNSKYDLLDIKGKHKGRKGKTYTIGVDNSEPIQKGGTGFLEIPYVAGRQVFCSLGFAQNWLWSVRNNLSTIVRFYGGDYSKLLEGGEDIDKTTEKAKAGDPKAKEILETYCLEDNEHHLFLFDSMCKPALELAYAFETDISSICFPAKSRTAMKFRDKRYFQRMNTFRKNRQADLEGFDINDEKINLLKDADFKFKAKRGFFNENQNIVAAHLNILPYVLKKSLKSDPSIRRLYDAIEKADNTIDKIVLSQGLDAFAEEAILDLNNKKMPDYVYNVAYGLPRYEVKALAKDFAKKFQEFLNETDSELINYTNKFVIIRSKDDEILQKLENCDFFTPMGIADWTISGSSGRVITKVNGNILGMSWDYMARRGLRTKFERKTLLEIIDKVDNEGLGAALNFCAEQYRVLWRGNVSKKDLIYTTTAREELENYPASVQDTRRYKDMDDLEAEKDKEVRYGYADDFEEPTLEEEFLKPEVEPDIPKYMQHFFGKLFPGYIDEFYTKGKNKGKKKTRKNGTIGEIILALSNFKLGNRKVDEITGFLKGEKLFPVVYELD